MTKRIFRSILLVAGAVLLVSFIIIMAYLYDHFTGVQTAQMKDELDVAATALEDGGTDYLGRLRSEHYRFTWIAADGTVLYDTQRDAESMENHADREEVAQALATGRGQSARSSSTLLERMLYCAKRQPDGTVLRVAVSQMTVSALVLGMLQPVLLVLVVALILSGVLADKTAKRIAEPLIALDLDHALENDTYEELSPLLLRLNLQQQEISAQMERLQSQREEFAQITESMIEAFVLLDNGGKVVSLNRAAGRLFHTSAACVGRDFLTVERNPELNEAIARAGKDGHSRLRQERDGRSYQFELNRIETAGSAVGTVLLAFDVSEQAFAERNRREFTANVSHELKTPLQSIIGSAELLENGLVKPEDTPRFVASIRREATRLVALIEDIIRLSQVDEGKNLSFEKVELAELTDEIADSLRGVASAKSVSLTVESEPVRVSGVRRLLYEIVYNLCDNAIKYNREGGAVRVRVAKDGRSAVIAVADTGIGIPEADQARVFERFYRVDKSRSKASGGTGLGLSIVKHAVELHHGAVLLQSKLGEGTEIRVTLPIA